MEWRTAKKRSGRPRESAGRSERRTRHARQCRTKLVVAAQEEESKRTSRARAGLGAEIGISIFLSFSLSFTHYATLLPPTAAAALCGRRRGTATLRHAASDWQVEAAAAFRPAANRSLRPGVGEWPSSTSWRTGHQSKRISTRCHAITWTCTTTYLAVPADNHHEVDLLQTASLIMPI